MAYRVLILGCGAIAGGYDAERDLSAWPLSHAGAIARDSRFKLAACVDPDDAARAAFAKRWGVSLSHANLENLNSQPGGFDVIVIASPTAHHAAHLEWALGVQPRLVFCEKPLAAAPEAIPALLSAYEATRVPLAVNYTRRWAPDMVELAQGWRAQWGAFLAAHGTYAKGVIHNGSHMVDLLHMMLGPLGLHGVGTARFDHWDDDPSVSALLRRKGEHGPCVHLVASDARAFTQFELVLSFERGEVSIRDGGLRIEERRVIDCPHAPGHRQLGPPSSRPGLYERAMSAAYANIADALETGAPLASNGESAFAAHTVCENIRRAALQPQTQGALS